MVLEGLENEAREAKKGLWADPAPIPPWVYRKARREQSLDLSDLVPLNSETEYSGTSRGPPHNLVRLSLSPCLALLGCCWFSGHPLTLIRPAFRTPWD